MTNLEIDIPVGDIRVKMRGPGQREESSERISFWWGLTTAAVQLARTVESMNLAPGDSALELGCGLGLPGIVAGLRGARVNFTDYVPEALEFARGNAALNGLLEPTASFSVLDWENPADIGRYDLILGAEILYDYFFHGSLIRLLENTLARNGRIALADRKRLCVARFLGRMADKGFLVDQNTALVEEPGFPAQDISVFTITRAK